MTNEKHSYNQLLASPRFTKICFIWVILAYSSNPQIKEACYLKNQNLFSFQGTTTINLHKYFEIIIIIISVPVVSQI